MATPMIARLPAWLLALAPAAAAQDRPPNVVVVLADDLGYADVGPFGATGYPTPHLDRMAREGMRFTDFAVPSAVCSASRAALLTGCYHRRLGIGGALGPEATTGLSPDHATIAAICRQRGYATACFGKWHLGHRREFLPLRHGFDDYFGLPYSHDMRPLRLLEGDAVADEEVTAAEQAMLTTWYTERAVDFVGRHRDRPFFLYLAHSMPHVPLAVSDRFAGKSGRGSFADAVMEIDWSVGQVLGALERHGIDRDTLVVFTSDNGPWLGYGEHAGSAAPLREGKGTAWEGGCRVPAIARWPGRVPAGATCRELASTIDLLPTVAALLDAPLPARPIDGRDIRPLLFGEPGARSPHEAFCGFHGSGRLQTVRDRRWKLVLPHRYPTLAGRPGGAGGEPVAYEHREAGTELYDLHADPGETTDVAGEHPDVVQRLQRQAARTRAALGEAPRPPAFRPR